MKKIIAIVLALVLVAGGLGGFAYANSSSHEPLTGQKLVGMGRLGSTDYPDGMWILWQPWFRVTNPDCISEITIERISIIKSNGTVIYEGPLLLQETDEDGEVVSSTPITTLKPHEIRIIPLWFYMPDPGDEDHEWMSGEEAKSLPGGWYTVEIFWSWTENKGLPLIGWANQMKFKTLANGECMESSNSVPMVNMEQVLEPAKEKEVTTLRLQTWYQTEEPFMEPLENFAQAVEDGTKGSVRIELYPSNALVPNPELAEAVRQGEIEMGLIFSAFLQETPSLVDAPQLPFLYNSEDGLMAAVKAGIGDLMSEQIEDITVLDWTTTGFAHLYNRLVMDDGQVVLEHPIIHPDDVDGLKIRSMDIPAKAIAAWGGMTVFTPFHELYQALAGKVIDGAMHSPYIYEWMCLYEVAPYFCVDYGFAELAGLCINSKVWKEMDADTQQIITTAAGAYVDEMLVTVKQVDADALQWITDYGVEVKVLTPVERLVWRDASQLVWDSWLDDLGPEGSELRLVGEDIIAIALSYNPLP